MNVPHAWPLGKIGWKETHRYKVTISVFQCAGEPIRPYPGYADRNKLFQKGALRVTLHNQNIKPYITAVNHCIFSSMSSTSVHRNHIDQMLNPEKCQNPTWRIVWQMRLFYFLTSSKACQFTSQVYPHSRAEQKETQIRTELPSETTQPFPMSDYLEQDLLEEKRHVNEMVSQNQMSLRPVHSVQI